MSVRDNDLLDLWLRAGDLDRDAVRRLIEELQGERNDRAEELKTAREVDALEADLAKAEQRIEDLENELREGCGL